MRTQINYIQLIKASLYVLWKYRYFFVFFIFLRGGVEGFLAALLLVLDPNVIDRIPSVLSVWGFILAYPLLFIFIIFLLALTLWYVARIFIISSYRIVKYDKEGPFDKLRLIGLLVSSHDVILKVALADVLYLIVFLSIFSLLLIPFVVIRIPEQLLLFALLMFFLFMLILPVLFVLGFARSILDVLIINDGMKIFDALKRSFAILKRDWLNVILLRLIFLVVGLFFSNVTALIYITDMVSSTVLLQGQQPSLYVLGVLFFLQFLLYFVNGAILVPFDAFMNLANAKFVDKVKHL